MKRLILPALLAALIVLSSVLPIGAAGPAPITVNYPDVTFSGTYAEQIFPHRWNIVACDLTVSYTLNLSNAPAPGPSAMTQVDVGIRDNPNGFRGGMEAFYVNGTSADNQTDLNDKFVLVESPNGYSESGYNADGRVNRDTIVSPPFGSDPIYHWTYGFWFDRTTFDPTNIAWGFDKIQSSQGIYNVVLTFHSVLDANGQPSPHLVTEWATVNGAQALFYNGAWHDGPPNPNDIYPAGRSLTGVFGSVRVQAAMGAGQGGSGSATISNFQVTGCTGPRVYIPVVGHIGK